MYETKSISKSPYLVRFNFINFSTMMIYFLYLESTTNLTRSDHECPENSGLNTQIKKPRL